MTWTAPPPSSSKVSPRPLYCLTCMLVMPASLQHATASLSARCCLPSSGGCTGYARLRQLMESDGEGASVLAAKALMDIAAESAFSSS
eukprot:scaffold5822_cov255-Prasinococcus_capsulatus_cf.AAC.3